MLEPQVKRSTANPVRIVAGLSDTSELALNEQKLSVFDKFFNESVAKQVEKEVLVKVDDEKTAEYHPHADPMGAAYEAEALTLRTIRKARVRINKSGDL